MSTESTEERKTLEPALHAFIKSTTMDEGLKILKKYPELLSDEADLLFSTIIVNARKQGQETTAKALDERRDFIRNVREEFEENIEKAAKDAF
jgi:hypothetical protein